jgi:hypothetical protein
VRPARAEDIPFIFDNWLEGYRDAVVPRGGARDRYYRQQRRRLTMLWNRGARFLVAVDPTEPDFLYGFICAELPLLHYVCVKKPFRGNGVALQLLAAAGLGGASPLLVTHWTGVCDKLAIKRPALLKYVGTDVPTVLGELDAEPECGPRREDRESRDSPRA